MVNVLVRGRAWLIADEEQVGELVQVLEEVRLSVHADIYPDALDAPWEHELLGVGCELERQALQVRQEPMDRYNGVKSLVLTLCGVGGGFARFYTTGWSLVLRGCCGPVWVGGRCTCACQCDSCKRGDAYPWRHHAYATHTNARAPFSNPVRHQRSRSLVSFAAPGATGAAAAAAGDAAGAAAAAATADSAAASLASAAVSFSPSAATDCCSSASFAESPPPPSQGRLCQYFRLKAMIDA